MPAWVEWVISPSRLPRQFSSEEKAAFAQSQGAELTIDYRRNDFVEAALAWTDGLGLSLILDTVGGETFCKSFATTRLYGRIVSLLSTPCDARQLNTARLRNLSIGYVQMAAPPYFGLHPARVVQTAILEQGWRLFEQGILKVHGSRKLPLAEAAEAHRLIEAGHTWGKIVFEIA